MFFIINEDAIFVLNRRFASTVFRRVYALSAQRLSLSWFSVVLLFVFLGLCAQAQAQDGSSAAPASVSQGTQDAAPTAATPVYKISMGDTLHDFPADPSSLGQTTWVLTSPDGQTLHGQGTSLLSYRFEQVGKYTIVFTRIPQPKHEHKESDGHRCDHYHMPPSISLQVAAEKIEYLCETMKTSRPIVGGQSTEGITLSVMVNVTGNKVKIPEILRSLGIETTIVGELDAAQKTLQAGIHTLVYHLSGQGKQGTYIQFDFEDTNNYMTPCVYRQQL